MIRNILYAYLYALLIGVLALAGCAPKDQGITGRMFATGIGAVRDCRHFTGKSQDAPQQARGRNGEREFGGGSPQKAFSVGRIASAEEAPQQAAGFFTTEQDIENCTKSNRPSTDPLKGRATIKVISLKDSRIRNVDSDQQGAYRIDLDAGEYQVCVGSKCSPPLVVKDGEYTNYDFVFPRP